MFKKGIIILGVILAILFISQLYLRAQNYTETPPGLANFIEGFAKIEKKVEELSQKLNNHEKTVLQKLDEILANQQKILKELDVVKIRASRKS